MSAIADAADQPISAQTLKLQRHGSTAKLVFTSNDPGVPFPAIGSADDPAHTAGAVIEVFSASEGTTTLTVPAGIGKPGWKVSPGTRPTYRFVNGLAPNGPTPVAAVVLKQGKALKLKAKGHGLALTAPAGSVGIRITFGSQRACALFDGATVRRDEPGAFVAKNAAGSMLTDCSDAALLGTPSCAAATYPTCGGTCPGDGVCVAGFVGCRCESPSAPCGDTSAPSCGGTCAPGEQCAALADGAGFECGCIATGATPCGNPAAPVCGGTCPSDLNCEAFVSDLDADEVYCGCRSCDCPPGTACSPRPDLLPCIPISCDGPSDHPTCGGSCAAGASCHAITIGTSDPVNLCVCAADAPCCAGGLTCPAGQACSDTGTTCGCVAP